jgi:effector-binding domain-containing protein
MEYVVRLELHSGCRLAVVRRRAASHELWKVVPAACGTVWNVILSQQVPGAGRHVAVYLDGQINLEVGVELDGPFGGHGEVVVSATPAGPVATTTHFGPYHLLREAHEAVCRWCANNGYTLAGPNWEVYVPWKDEWNTDPTKIATEVFYLLTADAVRLPNAALYLTTAALADSGVHVPRVAAAREPGPSGGAPPSNRPK